MSQQDPTTPRERPGERPGRAGRRIMRRTLQPRRPLVFPEQWGLVLLTALALVGGLAIVVVVLLN
jgi:hypothetical protein